LYVLQGVVVDPEHLRRYHVRVDVLVVIETGFPWTTAFDLPNSDALSVEAGDCRVDPVRADCVNIRERFADKYHPEAYHSNKDSMADPTIAAHTKLSRVSCPSFHFLVLSSAYLHLNPRLSNVVFSLE